MTKDGHDKYDIIFMEEYKMEKRSVTTFAGNPITLLGKEVKVGEGYA